MENRLAVMAVVVGVAILGGALALQNMSFSESSAGSQGLGERSGIMGHVTLTVIDPDGNITRYIQGDNVVTDVAENCIGNDFTGDTGTFGTACAGLFDDVAVGTSSLAVNQNQVDLAVTNTAGAGTLGGFTAASGGAASFTLTKTFTDPGATTYKEASIFDDAGTDIMLARKIITATLSSASDDLAIQWTITIGS